MKTSLVVLLVTAILAKTYGESPQIDFGKVISGNLEDDPEFQKRFPNIPGRMSGIDERIVGGKEAIPNSLPYQIGMFTPTPQGNSFCGGSLINARTVLTAAHCVDTRIGNVTIVLGAHNMPPGINDTNVVLVNSGDIVIHAGWNRFILLHDIAIVRFTTAVPLNIHIRPILLPRDNSHDYLGNTTLVSGWGRPSDNVNAISPVLRQVTIYIISNFPCRLAYFGTVQDSHICTSGAYGRGTCQGDSGGPLTINGVLVGVVSFGSGWGCAQGWPAVYARVTYYLDWIAANLAPV